MAQKAQDAIDNAAVGSVNLLRNSGFTGDYETEDLSAATELSADTELFSKQLEYWTGVATVSRTVMPTPGTLPQSVVCPSPYH